jgi:hypothetical protein
VLVEFFSNNEWHVLGGASAVELEPGVYRVTVSGLAAMWMATPGLFDGMLLRVDGREAKAIVDAQRDHNVLVLRACAHKG